MTLNTLAQGGVTLLYFLLVAGYLFFLYRVNRILSLN